MVRRIFHHGHLIQVLLLVLIFVIDLTFWEMITITSIGMLYSFIVSDHKYTEENLNIIYDRLSK